MSISARIIAQQTVPAGALIGPGATISQAFTTSDIVHPDEWLLMVTTGGVELQTTGSDAGYPFHNRQMEMWASHPSIRAIQTMPNLSLYNGILADNDGIQILEVPATMMTQIGSVSAAIPAGETVLVYWYNLLAATVQQKEYVGCLIALKTSPAIVEGLISGLSTRNDIAVDSGGTDRSPTLSTSISVTQPGSERGPTAHLLIATTSWNDSSTPTFTDSGWTELLTYNDGGGLQGAVHGRLISAGDYTDYTLTATWAVPVYHSMMVETANLGQQGLHVWQRI